MRFLTLLFLSCATHRRTISTVSTVSTAKTVVEATTTINENRDSENRDTTTLHLHTITYTARDTVHLTHPSLPPLQDFLIRPP